MKFYTDPTREHEPTSLPNAETFEVRFHDVQGDMREWAKEQMANDDSLLPADLYGYYWHSCFPGCLPDGEPNGPFDTEALAIADAQADAPDAAEEPEPNPTCQMCGGPGISLGTLGRLEHFRCRNCGVDFSYEPKDTATETPNRKE